jgi:hypothetical protein
MQMSIIFNIVNEVIVIAVCPVGFVLGWLCASFRSLVKEEVALPRQASLLWSPSPGIPRTKDINPRVSRTAAKRMTWSLPEDVITPS